MSYMFLCQNRYFLVDHIKLWESSFGRRRVTCSILNLLCELNMPFVCKRPRNNNETILQFHPNNDKWQSFHVNALTLLRISSSQKKWHAPMGCLSQDSTGRQSANPLKRIDVETAQFSSVGSFLCSSPAQKNEGVWQYLKKSERLPNMKLIPLKGSLPQKGLYIIIIHIYICKKQNSGYMINMYMFCEKNIYINKYIYTPYLIHQGFLVEASFLKRCTMVKPLSTSTRPPQGGLNMEGCRPSKPIGCNKPLKMKEGIVGSLLGQLLPDFWSLKWSNQTVGEIGSFSDP